MSPFFHWERAQPNVWGQAQPILGTPLEKPYLTMSPYYARKLHLLIIFMNLLLKILSLGISNDIGIG